MVEILLLGVTSKYSEGNAYHCYFVNNTQTWIFLAENPNLLCQNPAASSLGHETALLFASLRTPILHKHHLSAYFKA
jgi:hypothetical protein